MPQAIECALCHTTFPVDEEDTDSAIDDVVHHVVRSHDRDPQLAANAMQLIDLP